MALSAEDKLEMMELANEFENSFDRADFDAHMNTWVDDLMFESSFGNHQGKAAYREWLLGFYNSGGQGKRHLITNCVIKGDGNTAEMTCYLTILERQISPGVVATAMFHDRLVKADGSWKFAHRKLELDPSFQPPQP